ncbi:MAG: succinate dehydrogenase, hydrophobic membrane anchor protein [Alphaproteobacteria bacterium]|nr:MAG: succinate dehydrogenase, hydrophobic membrane anchor protein [Alphaproteobacteria bacterium]
MSRRADDFRSVSARVRGLGSAKEGVQHWWLQRLSALALIPLSLWLVASLVAQLGADHAVVLAWIGEPVTVALLLLTIFATFYHAQLGLQVVIEDYVHREGAKIAAILLVKAASLVLGLAGVLAVLFIAFGK